MAQSRSLYVIVWEWETNDNGIFVPYDELSSNLIETEYAAGMQYVRLSELGPNYSAWTVDLSAMLQHSTYFGRKRKIQRKTYSSILPIAYGVAWEFHGDLDWQQFDVRTSAIIEQNYSNGEATLALQEVNSSPMIIDFSTMVARNNQNLSLKRVRRRALQEPYIGGSVGPLPTPNLPHQISLRNRNKQPTRKKKLPSKKDGKIIVWESETDFPGVFAPYSETKSNLIEQQYAAGMRKVSVSLNSSNAIQVNFISMKVMLNQYGRECAIRRVLYSNDVPIASKISWEWMGDLDWKAFQVETSILIEDHYQKGDNALDLCTTPLNIPNILSFTKMNQKNKIFGTERQVRRRIMSAGYTEEQSVRRKGPTLAVQRLPDANTSGAEEAVRGPEGHEGHFDLKAFNQKRDKRAVDEVVDDKKEEEKEDDGDDDSNEDEVDANKSKTLPKTYILVKVPITHPILKQFCCSCDSVEEDDECSICLFELRHPSETYGAASKNSVIELKKCHHKFHECCLIQYYENGNKDGSMQCPVCKSINGIKRGNQPPGTMTVQRIPGTVPGYSGSGCIQVTYNIRSGIQGREHPNPGQPYCANGFPRVAYLPDNPKGNKVLQLLQEAWNRKLIFTVGTSVTSGMQNAVVWNEIHHKTEAFSNSSGHGYPDPNYLDNVLSELRVQGVE